MAVGTVPAEVFCLLLSFLPCLGQPCKTASPEVAAPGLSQLGPLEARPQTQRVQTGGEGRKVQSQRGTKSPQAGGRRGGER